MSTDDNTGWRNWAARFLSTRSLPFWAVTVTVVSVGALFIGSQIAHDRGQSVDWYTGFGQWLGALGSFIAAGAALWIATSDRRREDEERRRVHDQQETDLRRQAGLVRVTAEMIGRAQAAGPSIGAPAIGVRNRRADRIFDIEVVKFVHGGAEMELKPEMVNGFNISPPRPSQEGRFYFDSQLKGLALEPDEWLVIYQQNDLPNTPADYAAVRYTDRGGRRWEVDTRGVVARC
ncbi:hypothetical protein KN246_14695 [Mycobacterium intracellulare]|uniref:hypothetical protein n=1 Tax=Mycobacterium intracellulare TaxID=1767 RepID=UPI0012DB6A9C|nr:hypothetical protein [Mycobacterium intracellulare]UGT99318.1 hypothetical protein LTQ55_12615 [Mycobacterium intracellulare]UGU08761.1 hypothetical protein LTQ56_09065 [Mycobacterium intracellulare subsp. intracellulare]UQB95535.1 hypothetical protein KN246_14695 [Mycobacterium intracellulare]